MFLAQAQRKMKTKHLSEIMFLSILLVNLLFVLSIHVPRVSATNTLISNFEDLTLWVKGVQGTIAADTTHYKDGVQGGNWTSVNGEDTNGTLIGAWNFSSQHFKIWVFAAEPTDISSLEFIFSPSATFASYFTWSYITSRLLQGWNELTLSRAQFASVGGAGASDWQCIIRICLRVKSLSTKTASVTFDNYEAIDDPSEGKVTIMFDDGWSSVYAKAMPTMNNYNMRGVVAVVTSQVGGEGFMNTTQLLELQKGGWDIISHTSTHADLTKLSNASLTDELVLSQRWLLDNGFSVGSRFLSVPYNAYNSTVDTEAKKYYTAITPWDYIYETVPPNFHNLRCYTILNTTTVSQIQHYIDGAKAYHAWLILKFHQITSPADAQTKYTPENFASVINYINSTGLKTVTLSDVLLPNLNIRVKDWNRNILTGAAVYANETTLMSDGNGWANFTKRYALNSVISVNVAFQDLWVNGTFTVTMDGHKTIDAVCQVYSLTLKVQTATGDPVPDCPLELWREGTLLNGKYGLPAAPKTNSSGMFTWQQLANQTASYTVKSSWAGFSDTTTSLTENKLLTITLTGGTSRKIPILIFIPIIIIIIICAIIAGRKASKR